MNPVKNCIKIAVFASGSGTNAQNLIETFRQDARYKERLEIALVVCNNPHAYVIERARLLDVPCVQLPRNAFVTDQGLLELLHTYNIAYVVLAGFLQLIPTWLLEAYPGRILNIHPALLPKYGGKGMHGMHVHQAVVAARETQTGITVHVIDAHYDKGQTLFQATCPVLPTDTPEDVAAHIHILEQTHFPHAVAEYIYSQSN